MKIGEGECFNYQKNLKVDTKPPAKEIYVSPESEVNLNNNTQSNSLDLKNNISSSSFAPQFVFFPQIKLTELKPANLATLTDGTSIINDANGNPAGKVIKKGDNYTIDVGSTTINFSGSMHSLNENLLNKIVNSNFNGDVTIKNDSNNGGREVAVFMPKKLENKDNPHQVNYYFHGMHSQGTITGVLFGGDDSKKGIMSAVQKVVDKGQVFVLAQGPHLNDNNGFTMKNDPNSKAKYESPISSWFKKGVDDFAAFRGGVENDIRQKYGISDSNTPLPTTYSGHSAGGQVMLNILKSNDENLKGVDKIVSIDASYGSLPELIKTGANVYYYHNTNGSDIQENKAKYPNYTRIAGSAGDHYGSNSTAVSDL